MKSGAKVNVAYCGVFVENEGRKRKWTDEQMLQKMQADFPTRKTLAFTSLGGLQAYRSAYNRGKFNGGARPKTQSHPYSSNGSRLEVTRGRKAGVTTTAKSKSGTAKKVGTRGKTRFPPMKSKKGKKGKKGSATR